MGNAILKQVGAKLIVKLQLMLMGSLNGVHSDLKIKYVAVLCQQDSTIHFHLGAVARNQDKRLSRDIQVILDDFSFDLVARKQLELSPAK